MAIFVQLICLLLILSLASSKQCQVITGEFPDMEIGKLKIILGSFQLLSSKLNDSVNKYSKSVSF